MPRSEIPSWVRRLDDTRWLGSPGPNRREAHLIEAFCVGWAVVLFAASFLARRSTCVAGTTAFLAQQDRGIRLLFRRGDTGYSDYPLPGFLIRATVQVCPTGHMGDWVVPRAGIEPAT